MRRERKLACFDNKLKSPTEARAACSAPAASVAAQKCPRVTQLWLRLHRLPFGTDKDDVCLLASVLQPLATL